MPVSTKPENSGLRSLADIASPAAKPLRIRWLRDDKPRVNANYKKVPKEFIENQRQKSPAVKVNCGRGCMYCHNGRGWRMDIVH